MKTVALALLLSIGSLTANTPKSIAQRLEVRQLAGGFIRVQSEAGLDLLICPNEQVDVPDDLKTVRSLVLGSEFDRMVLKFSGKPIAAPVEREMDVPPDAVAVESVLIGKKRAGIQLKAEDLNVLIASVDLMSDQGFIARGEKQELHLVVLTFDDTKSLHTARTNLWISLVECQQIALNPTGDLSVALMDKFYKSLKRNRTLPTAVLPMIEVPNSKLRFGDRQVVLLKELE